MEFGTKLKELEMTKDEVERLSKALNNETFRKMLHEYAEEISNPENKKKYEEEIAQLEQERGMEVKFIHPTPHHVLKTSVDGKEKCFINICSNTLINKPSSVPGRAENGQLGQQWSLPYSLTPGRPDRDNKGKKCTVYDVVFHPDTLHIAAKNLRFMKLVNDTAVQGVEGAFKVKLDRSNAKSLKMQYKGAPYAAVLRKAIPGQGAKKPEDTFPIPYPETVQDEDRCLPTVPTQDSSLPTEPSYTVKYRSTVDLQDYRSTRDSAPSPRPEKIVITVDLPLLKSAADVDLDVTERTLTLESRKPAYRLDMELSYPVDEDRGDAKFNKAKKQLTITLPVKPSEEQSPCGPWGNILDAGGEDDESPDRVEAIVHKPELVKPEIPSYLEAELVRGESDYQISPVEVNNANPEPSSSVRADAPSPSLVNGGDKPMEQKISVLSHDGHPLEDGPAREGTQVDRHETGLGSNPDFLISVETDETLPCERSDDGPGLKSKTMTGTRIAADICTKNVPHDKNCQRKDEDVRRPGGESTENSTPGRDDTSSAAPEHIKSVHTPAILREITSDGGEAAISDHTTSAALAFQNSLWFELD